MRHPHRWLALFVCAGCTGAPASDDARPHTQPADAADEDVGEDAGAAAPPNIVYIVLDDLDTIAMQHMPKARALIADEGVELENYFFTYAVCCPSRTSVLTGKYPHNHRVLGNSYPRGGFRRLFESGQESSTVAVWLQERGYHTALIGKYLNQYSQDSDPTYVPPGWSEWFGRAEGAGFYDYSLVENGTLVRYGGKPKDYGTDVIARKAVALIERQDTADDQPFFLYLAPAAPHGPATSAPRHAELFAGVSYPRAPSFNEKDVSDKPSWIRAKPRHDADKIRLLERRYRDRLRSLQAADDLVEDVVAQLTASGELDNTFIIFASDNGFHLGEHRLAGGKRTAYEHDIRVPMWVRGPGVPRGETRSHWILNIDLAATMAELAGAEAPITDGVSFRDVLSATPPPADEWRRDFIVINRYLETDLDDEPDIDALRSGRYKYIESNGGERELYDLLTDPHELNSIHATADPALLQSLRARMMELSACSGAECW
ncbi:MAG TPA: sulfatase [Kofleriaceae bacterium]|nr:sulfatase [Kofleriaceae bacterium]